MSKSADSSTIIQLLPPNSRIVFPNLDDTTSLTCLPIFVEPVKEISGTDLSLIIVSPTVEPPPMTKLNTLGASFTLRTSLHIF